MARPISPDYVGMRWRRPRNCDGMSTLVFFKYPLVAAIFKNTLRESLVDPMVVPGSQVEQGPDMKRMIRVSGTMFGQQLSNGLRF